MAGATGYGVYRILKARIDIGHGGYGGKIFAYVLYDSREIKLFHYGLLDGEMEIPHGIKAPWRDFSSFVDGGLGLSVNPELAAMASDLSQVLQEVGLFDLKEENMTKTRYLEKVFSSRAAQVHDDQCVAFLKIEGMTSLEAEELMERFASPKAPSEEGSDENEGEQPLTESVTRKKVPSKLVFSCSAVLDPVRGVPVSDVRPGDLITVAIPEDSPLYRTMKDQAKQEGQPFDGKVDLILSTLSESDSERLILEFDLGDGVTVVLIAQKTLRIKALTASTGEAKRFLSLSPFQLVIVGISFFLLIILLLLIIRR